MCEGRKLARVGSVVSISIYQFSHKSAISKTSSMLLSNLLPFLKYRPKKGGGGEGAI